MHICRERAREREGVERATTPRHPVAASFFPTNLAESLVHCGSVFQRKIFASSHTFSLPSSSALPRSCFFFHTLVPDCLPRLSLFGVFVHYALASNTSRYFQQNRTSFLRLIFPRWFLPPPPRAKVLYSYSWSRAFLYAYKLSRFNEPKNQIFRKIKI